MRLTLTPLVRHEWQTRCIGDVVPALTDYSGQPHVDITAETAAEIAAMSASATKFGLLASGTPADRKIAPFGFTDCPIRPAPIQRHGF